MLDIVIHEREASEDVCQYEWTSAFKWAVERQVIFVTPPAAPLSDSATEDECRSRNQPDIFPPAACGVLLETCLSSIVLLYHHAATLLLGFLEAADGAEPHSMHCYFLFSCIIWLNNLYESTVMISSAGTVQHEH